MATNSSFGQSTPSSAGDSVSVLKNYAQTIRPDAELLFECRNGSETAWSALVDKYRNLIFAIPSRYGFSRDECTDIFQEVCLDLLRELSRLREPQALPKWLIQVCAHKCYHWKKKRQRMILVGEEPFPDTGKKSLPDVHRILEDAQSEQILHDAISLMPQRCQQLIQMLFFEEPVLRYREVSQKLAIAQGSVATIRQRCLDRLQKTLGEMGF